MNMYLHNISNIEKQKLRLQIMVKICSNIYPADREDIYKEHFDKYSFPLSSFQKWAIESSVCGQHVLATAHTGSGKTLPAEFAIEYIVKTLKKKVVYTSPIKALSNQKFHEFSTKFPDISFGLLTGDIKVNTEANVVIMTAEILLNKLLQIKSDTRNIIGSFDMDIENELGCVVVDEAHYINDQERGKVWETTIMLLPRQIQLVMLSATLDSPEKFAAWVESRDEEGLNAKSVYLASTYERVVPLTHYSFITCASGIFKTIKDKAVEKEINAFCNKPQMLQTAKGQFQEQTFQKVKKMLALFQNKNHFVKRPHVLNQVCKYLVEHEMLPALCFIMSRKAIEICATEVTVNLLEFDSKVPYTISHECEQIIRKIPNFQEYLHLPEYVRLVKLLEKGIAIHHAGMMPVLRELVEILFAKGYIKLLFATESMAIGVNMPVKTTIFTEATKFDGNNTRPFHSHEYTQMAGRAGRRGIDTVGHVIHLNNLFRNMNATEYTLMMKGTPQKLSSKFKISYNLILNLIDTGNQLFSHFVRSSMIQNDINKQLLTAQSFLDETLQAMLSYEETIRKICGATITMEEVLNYYDLLQLRSVSVNSKRKEVEKKITKLKEVYLWAEKPEVATIASSYKAKQAENLRAQRDYECFETFVDQSIAIVLDLLKVHGFVEMEKETQKYKLTLKGQVATNIREVHCLAFAEYILSDAAKHYPSVDIVTLLSCFTSVSVSDDKKTITMPTSNITYNYVQQITNAYSIYEKEEEKLQINTGANYDVHYDLIEYVRLWYECTSETECKALLQQLEQEKEIFLGEFVKAILKINNIASELERVAELIGDINLLHKLQEIPKNTLKFVATNQSLYV